MLAAGQTRNIALACSQAMVDGGSSAELTGRGGGYGGTGHVFRPGCSLRAEPGYCPTVPGVNRPMASPSHVQCGGRPIEVAQATLDWAKHRSPW
jgi:hypothetical protein